MWKKILAAIAAIGLLFSAAAPLLDTVDAKPRYRSPSRSYTPATPKKDVTTPAPKRSDQVNNGTTAGRPGATPGTARPSFGGSLMRGLMIGGLAGLLFGGLFAGMGALGSLLGLAVNLFAIYILFVLVRKVIMYFVDRNRTNKRRYQ
ncbi:hypothetical protein [Paenibacillus thermotolerans]|uniref:hypothetical protein n=1 Tax=Paenibacillus thermotolerans TaxID=3027807 RepID=UPI002368D4E1|nr:MULTISPECIES: hypothetical protein [unclassified Paenibacillus]